MIKQSLTIAVFRALYIFFECMLKIMKKDVTHLSPKGRKTIPPYVENDSPALPLGHGESTLKESTVLFSDAKYIYGRMEPTSEILKVNK